MSLDSKTITVFNIIVHPRQNLSVFHSAMLALGLLPNCWYFANCWGVWVVWGWGCYCVLWNRCLFELYKRGVQTQ